jgi:hypothetical protein
MRTRKFRTIVVPSLFLLLLLASMVFWLYASVREMIWGERLLAWWDPYAFCGNSEPVSLPATVRIGLYEEFPVPWRLDKLARIDFPVTVALAAPSVAEFEVVREQVQTAYPQVKEIFYWPLLSKEEGYYPGPFSQADAVERVTAGSEDLPVLWDWELPLGIPNVNLQNWWQVHTFTNNWLNSRTPPTHIWRSHASMGLDPLFLRLIGMHYDPRDYENLYFHINMYTVGDGAPPDDVYRILRCGVETYGDRFIPDFGSLDDGEGPVEIFLSRSPQRDDSSGAIARKAGTLPVVNLLRARIGRHLHL